MVIALVVFIIAYIFIASEKLPRHLVALIGGVVLIVSGVLSPIEAFNYINWETIGLLAGMFALVAILEEAGFFKWLAMTAIRKVNYHPSWLFVILLLMAAFLAMWMDSITVMLFLSVLTLQLCRLLKLDPVPLIIAEVCAANTGGSATLVGDPPNVILGTTLGFNFADFVQHTGPISAVAALVLLGIFYLINRRRLHAAHAALTPATIREIERLHNDPVHVHMTRVGLIAFATAVTLLVLHIPISHALHIHFSAAPCAMIPALIALVFLSGPDRRSVFHRVDKSSLVFFMGLFVLIGGLEKVQVFDRMAEMLAGVAATNPTGLVVALHWGPGVMSGVVDNVPLALAMSYVLKDLSQAPGMPALALMVWALALGVNLGGNLTPIGASANVVAYSMVEKNHGKIGWKRWFTMALVPTLIVMIFATVMVMFKGHIGWY
jgi:Na+/H+ antiporter NhaD/arsenite permease-like protein